MRRFIVFCYDMMSIVLAWYLAYWMLFQPRAIPWAYWKQATHYLVLVLVFQMVSSVVLRLYRGQWRLASIPDVVRIIKSLVLGAALLIITTYFILPALRISVMPLPHLIIPFYTVILLLFWCGARFTYRYLKEVLRGGKAGEPVLIIGAGSAGEMLLRDLSRDHLKRYRVMGFLDDSNAKIGLDILGKPVLGSLTDLSAVAGRYAIQHVFVAMPSASGAVIRNIVSACQARGLLYRILPGLNALASGEVSVKDLRDVALEDLLGREAINLKDECLLKAMKDKTVLVTGGGGSIGSELARQLANLSVKSLIVLDHAEFNLYAIERDLLASFPDLSLHVCLVDVTDTQQINALMKLYTPDIVFHAAAYKHVPLLESQPYVAVKNNVLGTQVLAAAAVAANVPSFVLVSTDKAVNPTNVMGTTKRITELLCQSFNADSRTNFMTVRFGNVLGSRGSVVPLFKQQIKQGGPVTVTHPDITRYFMTIPEASQLILRASQSGVGGEVFVLDMGEPIKIADLARELIALSGKRVGEDVDITYTGLRPGEKLYEELFHDKESLSASGVPKLMKAKVGVVDKHSLEIAIKQLLSERDALAIRKALKAIVPEANV